MWSTCALAIVLAAADAPGRLRDALAMEHRGDDPGALRAVESLIRAFPQWELARIESARLRLKAGEDLDQAQLHLEAARAVAPENPRAQFLWGLLMEERGQVAEACRALELAVLYRSDYDEARFRLGGLYFAAGDWLKAELHYRWLAKVHPDATGPGFQLAAALEKQGRFEDAEIELRKLLDQQPRSEGVARRLAELYQRTGRSSLADKVRRSIASPAKNQKKMRPLRKSSR